MEPALWPDAEDRFLANQLELFSTLGPAFVTSAIIDGCVDRETGWCLSEALRARAACIDGTIAPDEAETLLRRVAVAKAQGSLSWELRAASSLASLLSGRGRDAKALDELGPVYGRFTEGHAMRDLLTARVQLQALVGSRRGRDVGGIAGRGRAPSLRSPLSTAAR